MSEKETREAALVGIETRQNESFSLLSPPREIFNQNSYDKADLYLRDEIKANIYALEDEFADIFKGAKASRSLYNKLRKPLLAMEVDVKAAMSRYKADERERKRAAVVEIKRVYEDAEEKRIEKRALELVDNCQVEEAVELLSSEPGVNTGLALDNVQFSYPKGLSSHTIIDRTFELIKESKLKAEFVIPEYVVPSCPDTAKIMKAVKEHGEGAEKIVGIGAIRYQEKIRIVSAPRRK